MRDEVRDDNHYNEKIYITDIPDFSETDTNALFVDRGEK